MESEEQRKDRERLARYIVREGLVSILNDTKWNRLRNAVLELEGIWPQYRIKDVRSELVESSWDGEWYHHFHQVMFKSIEWMEIDPIIKQHVSSLMVNRTDRTEEVASLLRSSHIPYTFDGKFFKIWGYTRPGSSLDFITRSPSRTG